jgi:hypothetical protein
VSLFSVFELSILGLIEPLFAAGLVVISGILGSRSVSLSLLDPLKAFFKRLKTSLFLRTEPAGVLSIIKQWNNFVMSF